MDASVLPRRIFSGSFPGGHCQGIAPDLKNRVMYYSFTTCLVKTDFDGRLIGTVDGLVGHLGCIVFHPEDGCVYGSLEYKNDAIGNGILKNLRTADAIENGFYLAVFDGAKITRPHMQAETDGILKAAFLRRVTEDYLGTAPDGKPHIHGCSGIDGTAIGPVPGAEDRTPSLFVAYGIYDDPSRTDNDCQILLRYDIADIRRTARPLSQKQMHRSGEELCPDVFFVYTGNTAYGVQNLDYDPDTHTYVMCVYPGRKEGFPNAPLYRIDAAVPPKEAKVPGCDGETGRFLTLCACGDREKNGIRGDSFAYGSTGFAALGGGLYYVSYDGRDETGWNTTVRLMERGTQETFVFAKDVP